MKLATKAKLVRLASLPYREVRLEWAFDNLINHGHTMNEAFEILCHKAAKSARDAATGEEI